MLLNAPCNVTNNPVMLYRMFAAFCNAIIEERIFRPKGRGRT